MIKSRRSCARNTAAEHIALAAVLSAMLIALLPTAISAYDAVTECMTPPESGMETYISSDELLLTGMDRSETAAELFAFAERAEPSLDFSYLNGTFTAEVYNAPPDAVLVMGDYDEGGALLKAKIVSDVRAENELENKLEIEGAYAKAFLWDGDMNALCESVTTKTDYTIVEGAEGEWEVSEDGHTLYSYLGSGTDVVIPNSYRGKRITAVYNEPAVSNMPSELNIADFYKYNIFGGRTDITSVTLSEGITEIYHFAFAGCKNISSPVPVSSKTTLLGNAAFYGCEKMTGSVDLSGVKALGGLYTFLGCASLDGTLTLANVGVVPDYMFYGCSGLNGALVIPERVKEIGVLAFGLTDTPPGNGGFASLSLPPELESIGAAAFQYQSKITGELTLPASVAYIGDFAFADCRGLCGALVIPEGVAEIGDFTFGLNGAPTGNGGFTSLSLPSTLKRIGFAAFQYQSRIKNELILPEGLEHIGDFAFNHCAGFANTSLQLPSSLETIGGDYNVSENTGYGCHVFYDSFKKVTEFVAGGDNFKSYDGVLCSADMKRIVAYPPAKADAEYRIPEGVEQTDEMAFGYSKIKDVYLPDSYAVSEEVPQNVINDMANNLAVSFYHYNSIENVYVSDTNENYISADGVLYSKDMKELWYVPTKKTGTVIIPEGVETIRQGAFYIESASGGETYTGVYIPASVTHIAEKTIAAINKKLEVTVSPENEFYEAVNGKLVPKAGI